MTDFERRRQIRDFINYWKNRDCKEKQEDESFWISFFRDVLGQNKPEQLLDFQTQTDSFGTKWIDAVIPSTKILIEQKGKDVKLDEKEQQSDGAFLTPYEQAKRYDDNMNFQNKSRWIVTCNFIEMWIYDMTDLRKEPEKIFIKDLEKEYKRLDFFIKEDVIIPSKEEIISKEAGDVVKCIYESIASQLDMELEKNQRSVNELCVRLVFCLYAEDSGLFSKNAFRDFIARSDEYHLQEDLKQLFKVLNTKEEDRDQFLRPDLKDFPYVNGGLFEDADLSIPYIDEDTKNLILNRGSNDTDWSQISPTIFGAIFESTLNPETRRAGGMHYTSVENIHKVIDPLFLDELKAELQKLKNDKRVNMRYDGLKSFREKLSKLVFFDPACGSGNFLTETYISLRKLENEALKAMNEGKAYSHQISMGFDSSGKDIIKVHIQQFYGIEINDFAVSVATTALWIAESQMFEETKEIVNNPDMNFLPLSNYTNIKKANALEIDWEAVVPNNKCNYIIGNPPFVGSSRTDEKNTQKKEIEKLFNNVPNSGKLDYVCGWYAKAASYIQRTNIKCAFVSTNSITQGEQVAPLWKTMFERYLIEIIFAHRSFIWKSESNSEAGVVCVIIGFTTKYSVGDYKKKIFEEKDIIYPKYINGYLRDDDDFYIKSRQKVFEDYKLPIIQGNKPWDGGKLILSKEDAENLFKKYPITQKYIKKYIGSREMLNNDYRYCLWLKDVAPEDYNNIPEIKERLKGVIEERQKTKTPAVREQAKTPMLFSQIRQPDTRYLAIPEVSSENRRYIPIQYFDKEIITSNKIFMIPDAPLYLFSILTSSTFMCWMRVVSGRLGTGFSFSPSVYNNFPIPKLTDEDKQKLSENAQNIIDIRNKFVNSNLKNLYNPISMPPELTKAHENNDKLVLKLYGMKTNLTEQEILNNLKTLYKKMSE